MTVSPLGRRQGRHGGRVSVEGAGAGGRGLRPRQGAGRGAWGEAGRPLPGPDIQLASVNDAGELKEDGEPASDPDSVTRSHVHVIACVFLQHLQ